MACVAWLISIAVLAPLLASCGSDAGADEIQLLVFGAPEELRAYRELIDAFERAQGDVQIQLIEASDRVDLIARLATSFSGGDPPDLFIINYRFYGQFASKGVIEPMQPLLDASDEFGADDFYQVALDAFRDDSGQLVCMPQNASSLVVYYNRDLFLANGVDEPTAGWTWDDMVDRARQLTADTDGDGVIDRHGLGVEASLIRVAPFVWSNGGEIVDDNDHPTRLTMDSPAAIDALNAFLALRTEHAVVPGEEDVESEDDESRFANGRLAMVMSSRRSTTTFREAATFDWDVVPLPVFGSSTGILHSDAYCMAESSDHQDAAWRFVEFAVGVQGAPIISESGRTVPSLIAVAESPAFLDASAKPAHSQVFLDTIPTIRLLPFVSTWPEIEDVTAGILETALYAGTDAVTVVREMDRATRDIFARAER